MFDYESCDGLLKKLHECTHIADDGYNDCKTWGSECVDWSRDCIVSWIPVIGPAICKVFEWVCHAFQAVCTFAVWVFKYVCLAWKVTVVGICAVVETVLPVLSAVLGILIKGIFSIPVVGAAIRWIVKGLTSIIIGVVGVVVEGGLCGLLGICLSKRLRVCVIITNDGQEKIASVPGIQPIIDRMVSIYKDEANIDADVTFDSGAHTPNVDPDCSAIIWQDLGLPGSQYENSESLNCSSRSFASVIGLGSPVYAFA